MTEKARPFPRKTAFFAAALVVGAVGAVSGQAIGDTPMLRGGVDDMLPEGSSFQSDFSDLAESEQPPDHYPLETPQGTIPVAQLALHGRMRDRDHGWYATEDPIVLEAQYASDPGEDEVVQPERTESPSDRSSSEDAPVAHAQPVAGQARMIDVPAALEVQGDL